MITGWVKLHRQFIDWEWYDDINTKVLFIHCLIKANHKDKTWRGNEIKRGSFITSIKNLSNETGLTVQQVRTSFDKLESTGEINKRSTSVKTWVTINKYDDYQNNNTVATNEQQTSNKRVTTTKNEKNEKNEKNTIGFESFWDAYDKKVGSKKKAKKYWYDLSNSERERIMKYIKNYKASFKDSQFQPYATTFLNQKYFEAEEYETNKSNSVKINMDRFL